jgi:hypothetical protein
VCENIPDTASIGQELITVNRVGAWMHLRLIMIMKNKDERENNY